MSTPAGTSIDQQQIKPPTLLPAIWVYGEAWPTSPSGTPPATITLAQPLVAGGELVYRNGLRLTRNLDYTVESNVITWTVPLQPGDNVLVDYRTA